MADLRRRSQLVMHIGFLLCSAGVLLAAAFLRINEQGQVGLPWGGNSSGLPPLCMFQRLFETNCPGCGLTRCFVSMAHGDVTSAWEFHPVGIVFFAVVVAQIPYRGLQISRLLRGNDEIPVMAWAPWLAVLLGVLLVGQWVVRMVV